MQQGITDCSCSRYFSQPDCDIGWDSHRGRFYHGCSLYLLTASDSKNDLPVFPLLHPASRHDSLSFASTFVTMKAFLPDYTVSKLLLDPVHDAMLIYEYYHRERIVPFIDLNGKRGIQVKYRNNFTIGGDDIPVRMADLKM